MKKYLLAIVLAGLLLRLYGAGHGLAAGRIFHPDTPKQMMFFRHYLEGDYRARFRIEHRDYHGYPSFHIHIAEWAYRGMTALAGITRRPGGEPDEMGQWYFIRILTALFSAASIIFVYLSGKELFSEKAGLLAAALFAVNPFSVSMSHFIMGDTAMTFFAAAAFYFFVLCYKKQSIPMYLAGGLLAGFAAACKYNGGFILVPGLFALFAARPGRGTVYSFFALLFGAGLGFTIGNPSMFTHFSEGVRGASSFLAYASGLGWDSSEPRLLAALRALPAYFKMFVNLAGLLQFIALSSALVWMFWKRRGVKSFFAASFPVSYFILSIVSQPYPRALYLLVMMPFLSILAGWFLAEAGGGKKAFRSVLAVLAVFILLQGLLASFRESFLFAAGDTRVSAEEWLERNVPGYFEVGSSFYSARNPHEGSKVLEGAGSFYASSALAGMRYPRGGVPVKSFSLEDARPTVLHRNPDIGIFAYYGDELRPGFQMPVFNRPPYYGELMAPLFLKGAEFGLDALKFSVGDGRDFSVVSSELLNEIAVLLVNFNSPAEVFLKAGRAGKKISLAPGETRLLELKPSPAPLPADRHHYFFSFKIKKPPGYPLEPMPRVYAHVGLAPLQKAELYFKAGDFYRAAGYLAGAADSMICPVELEIMRALSYYEAGESGKASAVARDLKHWAEEYARDSRDPDDDFFREAFLENTGMSADYLEAVNTVRFPGYIFSSGRGSTVKRGEKGQEPFYYKMIECAEGERDMIFGPYEPLPRGNYFARFVFNLRDYGHSTAVACDVAARTGADILSAGGISGDDIGRVSEILLPFSVDAQTEFLEFRTFLDGPGKVVLYYVEVFPDKEQNTLDKAVLLRRIREGK